jgi:hypothetical protein
MGSRGGTRPGGVPVLFSTAAAGVSRHERSRPCSSSAVPHLQSVIHPRVSSTPKATVGEDRSVGGDSKRTTASTGRTGGGWSSVRRGWRGRSGLHCSREEKDVGGGGAEGVCPCPRPCPSQPSYAVWRKWRSFARSSTASGRGLHCAISPKSLVQMTLRCSVTPKESLGTKPVKDRYGEPERGVNGSR